MQKQQRPFMNDEMPNARMANSGMVNSKMLLNFPIAMAYVPMQQAPILYENLEDGYQRGTVFPELDKPFTGKRGRR